MERAARSVLVAACLTTLACTAPLDEPAVPAGETVALAGGGERRDLRFPCGDGTCAGWLYLPAGATRPPVVVMAHGFGGTRDVGLPAFAERFAADGLASFAFDYRHFGASSGGPRQLVDPWKQDEDWSAALAFVRTQEAIDPERVAVFGTSLGGGHALIAAAEDGRVRAVAAQVPLVDANAEGEIGFFGLGWLARLLLTGWADLAREKLTGRSIEIPAIAPASGFGMLVDDAAYTAVERSVPPGSTYRNAVTAHSVFTFDDWNPAPKAASIAAPVLVIASRADRFVPFSAIEALAAANPNVLIAELPGDHFEVYLPPIRDEAAALAARFLQQQLLR